MRSLGIRTFWTAGALVASLAMAPSIYAQSPAAAKAHRITGQMPSDTAGTGASQVIPPGGMPNGRTDTNGAAAAPGTAGAPAATPMMPPGGSVDTDTAGRTGTAYGQYQQSTGGGHNWGWIGIFGLLGLFGLGGRNRTMITEDRTTAARPTVNTRL